MASQLWSNWFVCELSWFWSWALAVHATNVMVWTERLMSHRKQMCILCCLIWKRVLVFLLTFFNRRCLTGHSRYFACRCFFWFCFLMSISATLLRHHVLDGCRKEFLGPKCCTKHPICWADVMRMKEKCWGGLGSLNFFLLLTQVLIHQE